MEGPIRPPPRRPSASIKRRKSTVISTTRIISQLERCRSLRKTQPVAAVLRQTIMIIATEGETSHSSASTLALRITGPKRVPKRLTSTRATTRKIRWHQVESMEALPTAARIIMRPRCEARSLWTRGAAGEWAAILMSISRSARLNDSSERVIMAGVVPRTSLSPSILKP